MSFSDQSMAAGAKRQHLLESFLKAYRKGELDVADTLITRLLGDGSRDPVLISYAGLLRALSRKEIKQGLEMCERAAGMGSYDPIVFLNLSRLHLATNSRSRAVATLRLGLRVHHGDAELLAEMRRLEPRREPILERLGRDHFANRILGRLATRLAGVAHG